MLHADVLNSDATLNNFEVIGTAEFMAGYSFTLVIRIKNSQSGLRYIPASGATLVAHLPNKDGTALDVTMTSFTDDRSIWTATITAEQSEDLSGGNMTFDLTEGANTIPGWAENGLALIVTGCCC